VTHLDFGIARKGEICFQVCYVINYLVR